MSEQTPDASTPPQPNADARAAALERFKARCSTQTLGHPPATGQTPATQQQPATADEPQHEPQPQPTPPDTTKQRHHDWNAIRAAWERGASVPSIARAYCVGERQIKDRKARDGDWHRITVSRCDEAVTATEHPPGGRHGEDESGGANAIATQSQQADPVLQVVGDTVGALIEAGLPGIEPPANLRQLSEAVKIYRQARGIGVGNAGGGPRVLINLAAGIRPRVRDAGTVIEAD